jgi:hypothetical protein
MKIKDGLIIASVSLSFCAGFFFLVCAIFLEILISFPLPSIVYISFFVTLLALTLLTFIWNKNKSQRLFTLISTLFYIIILTTLHLIPWSSRKPFLNDLYSINKGMTIQEVNQIMDSYIQNTESNTTTSFANTESSLINLSSSKSAHQNELTIENSLVYRHSNSAKFNADLGVVYFKNNQVISVEFLPD